MNSVVLARWRPDRPASGAALRNWQNIRALSRLGPVDVVTVGVDDAAEPVEGVREWAPFSMHHRSAWDEVKTRCWPLRPGGFPSIDLYHFDSVTRWLAERAAERRYDVAVVEGIALVSYLDDLKRLGCRVVYDAHNAESLLQNAVVAARSGEGVPLVRRFKDWVVQRRMEAVERRAVLGADVVWVCSEGDAAEIERVCGARAAMTVVPNGVDVDGYRRAGAPPGDGDWSGLPITLVYPGMFTYAPNEDAAMRLITEVLPAVRARGYTARAVFVGRDPTAAMLAAARRDPGVETTGTVESILPYLEQPCVATLPIRLGSGTRLKIVEAFAVGRAVVSTAKGAEGIEAADGEHLVIREDSAAIADAVIELWNSPMLRRRMCAAALDLARNRYSWSFAAQRIAQSLGSTTGDPQDVPGVGHAASRLRFL